MVNPSRFTVILTLVAFLLVVVGAVVAAEPAAVDRVLVKVIRITGAEALAVSELQPIVAPFVGKLMDLAELLKVADSFTEEYRGRGYNLARAIIPEQDISAGVVEIRVLEARIGKLMVEGNRYYSTSLIERAFAGLLRDKAVRQSSLEWALLVVSDQYPDINATAGLKAGADPGTTDIVVSAKDIFPAHLTFDYNNYGVRNVSRHIVGVQLDIGDPWIGSQFSFRENTGFDPTRTHNRRASYTFPINNYGTRFGGYFATGDFAVGGDLSDLNITGKSEGWGLSITHPFKRNRFHKLSGEFGFDLRDSTLFIDGEIQSVDRIRLLRAGLSYEGIDATGRNFASFYIFQGLGAAFGGMKNDNPRSSRSGAGGDFTYATINLFRLQTITNFLRTLVKTSGQISSAPLVASEQFGLGGPDTVKGYRFREVVGDNAFNANAELRVLPLSGQYNEAVQLSLGLDYGLIQQRKPAAEQQKYQSRLGYGPGLRFNWPFTVASRPSSFSVRFDAGFPITPAKNADGRRPFYYVQTALRF